jgi:hypothetical protein
VADTAGSSPAPLSPFSQKQEHPGEQAVKKPSRKKTSIDSSPTTSDFLAKPVPLTTPEVGTAFLELIRKRHFPYMGGLELWEDPEGDVEESHTVIEWAIARAIRALHDTAPPDEIERFRGVEQRAVQTQRIDLTDYDGEEFPEAWLWCESFFLWGTMLGLRRDHALFTSRPRFSSFSGFFLRQWWVSEMIEELIRQGHEKEVTWLLFGKRGQGNKHHNKNTALQSRNLHIKYLVRQIHREEGIDINPACRVVANQIGLRYGTVRTIYYLSPTYKRKRKTNQ